MVTTGPISGLPGLTTASTPTATQQWQTGQLLQATVAESSIGKVLLAIGNRQVSAQTSLPLEKGQQLTLQVRSLGELPVLRVITALNESPLTANVRLLLPRQGPLTPLLANMNQLARLPNPPTPPLLNELVRSTLKQMPDIQAVSTQQGLKKAVGNAGIFLESRLLQATRAPAASPATPPAVQSDFKANLLRLVQLVRSWPGSSPRTGINTVAPSPATPVSTPGALTQGAIPPAPVAKESTARAPGPPAQQPTPDQVQRTTRASLHGTSANTARSVGTASLPATTTATPRPAGSAGEALPASPRSSDLPAPLRGAVPVPQSALNISLDLVNRMGNFRTDLLQQAEAALARIQLHQLAAVPRESERGLLEWLFELPIRRGDDIDLWSMRLLQDSGKQQHESRKLAKRWTAQLAFDLPGLGPVQVQVQLFNEQVSARFWVEQTDTLPLLHEHMLELRAALHTAGLDVGELECQRGPRPTEKSSVDQPLIREKI